MNRVDYWQPSGTPIDAERAEGRQFGQARGTGPAARAVERRLRPRDDMAAHTLSDPGEAWRDFERLLAEHRLDIF